MTEITRAPLETSSALPHKWRTLLLLSLAELLGIAVWFSASVVVADSAQFSAAVSKLSPKQYMGTALTLQTSLGFFLTLFTIRIVPSLETAVGWRYAFTILAFGPAVGIWAMIKLRRSPEAVKLANGKG